MSDSKKIKLPSGAELEIWISPFEVAKELYQTLLAEAKDLKLDPNAQVDVNLYKDIFCAGFSSKKVEACIKKCFEKCTYNGARIGTETFEPAEARQDFLLACFEVAQENVAPFMKPLYAKFQAIIELLRKNVRA